VDTFFQDVLHCQVTSITCVKSIDGGDSWQHCDSPPKHLVAAQPYTYKRGSIPPPSPSLVMQSVSAERTFRP
jgi:hypothetical protein